MIVWIFRAVAIAGTPILTWLTVSKDLKGAAFGVLIGLVIIGVEYVFENVSLFSLIIGIIGAVAGIGRLYLHQMCPRLHPKQIPANLCMELKQ